MSNLENKSNGKEIIVFICVIVLFSGLVFISALVDIVHVSNLPKNDDGVEVSIQDYNGETVSLFITREEQLTNLTQDYNMRNESIVINDSTGCVVGDAIDLYDNVSYFQGIITDVVGNEIFFTPPLDKNFKQENTFVKCGEWNLNVDGSVNTQQFYINPPTKLSWDIESVAMQFQDNSDWDIDSFGSRTSLENGFTVNVEDGIEKQLFLIYNNGGFILRGGTIQNIEKAPSGVYGFSVDLVFSEKYGAVLELDGRTKDKLVARVRDDLTSQNEISFVVRGHIKTK